MVKRVVTSIITLAVLMGSVVACSNPESSSLSAEDQNQNESTCRQNTADTVLQTFLEYSDATLWEVQDRYYIARQSGGTANSGLGSADERFIDALEGPWWGTTTPLRYQFGGGKLFNSEWGKGKPFCDDSFQAVVEEAFEAVLIFRLNAGNADRYREAGEMKFLETLINVANAQCALANALPVSSNSKSQNERDIYESSTFRGGAGYGSFISAVSPVC